MYACLLSSKTGVNDEMLRCSCLCKRPAFQLAVKEMGGGSIWREAVKDIFEIIFFLDCEVWIVRDRHTHIACSPFMIREAMRETISSCITFDSVIRRRRRIKSCFLLIYPLVCCMIQTTLTHTHTACSPVMIKFKIDCEK